VDPRGVVLVIDNYDSFTYNLVQYLGELGERVVVHRNNEITLGEIADLQPDAAVLSPGPRHWQIFTGLCAESGARGNLVPDAYLAALAIETGSEWISTDRDYRRFRGLRLRHPLDA